jgi:hypothetical protein
LPAKRDARRSTIALKSLLWLRLSHWSRHNFRLRRLAVLDCAAVAQVQITGFIKVLVIIV